MSNQVHGTCVEINGHGVLLRGPPGSGKSDLALRLIDGGAGLVADDRVDLTTEGVTLVARAPANIHGMIEVRGVGLVRLPALDSARIAMVVDLVDDEAVDRLPEPVVCTLMGIDVRCLSLASHATSAAAKVRIAINAVDSNSLVAP
jgi:HPr kinase/phosphorylase